MRGMTASLAGRDLLSIADLSTDEIIAVLDLADAAKSGRDLGSPLAGRSLALIFQRPSNRMRVSFAGGDSPPRWSPDRAVQPRGPVGERELAADISRILARHAISSPAWSRTGTWSPSRGPRLPRRSTRSPTRSILWSADCMTVRSVTGRLAGATVPRTSATEQRLHLMDLRGGAARGQPASDCAGLRAILEGRGAGGRLRSPGDRFRILPRGDPRSAIPKSFTQTFGQAPGAAAARGLRVPAGQRRPGVAPPGSG